MGDTVENAISAPNRRNTIMGGTIHHNLFFHKYAARSFTIVHPFTVFLTKNGPITI